MSMFAATAHAEWLKLRTLRSTYVALLGALAFALLLGILDTSSAARQHDVSDFDAVGASLNGFVFAQLAFAVLGVLAVSSEYGTGAIRLTFQANPGRTSVFAAKTLVLGVLTIVAGEVFCVVTFLAGQAVLSSSGRAVGFGSPAVVRAVLSAGLYLAVVALVGSGLGALVRHTAGAISGMFALIFLAWPAAKALEGWSYLPSRLVLANAADVLAQTHAAVAHPERLPSLGLAYLDLALYALVALGLGVWRFSRDASG
jgi:ABC-type transport system involved in multi-copper enzyme maturation permease subunit